MKITITRRVVPQHARTAFSHSLFGLHFPMKLEPTIFNLASRLSQGYHGGLWEFYALSNGGFFMAPMGSALEVSCDNGFTGAMSTETFGVTVCLYAYCHLSFGPGAFGEVCAEHYHSLRDYVVQRDDASSILAACD